MSRLHPRNVVFWMCMLTACAPRAQQEPAAHPPPAAAPVLLPGDAAIQTAIRDAERGQLTATQRDATKNHPLRAWLDYAQLRRDIATVPVAEVNSFLRKYQGQPVTQALLDDWRPELLRREQWSVLEAVSSADSSVRGVRCLNLLARAKQQQFDAEWRRQARLIWVDGKPWAANCQEPMTILEQRGGVNDALRWERIDKAIAHNQAGVVRAAAAGLPPQDAKLANEYAAFLGNVQDSALQWPKDARSRLAVTMGLERLAKTAPDQVEKILPKWQQAFALDDSLRAAILIPIARQSAASYDANAVRRLAAVPEDQYDTTLYELRVREALARSDWTGALTAIRAMPAENRDDSARWNYFTARLLELTGEQAAAQPYYAKAAQVAEFHGFMAADRLDKPYALCPQSPPTQAVRDPGLLRALALHRIGRNNWALREWDAAAEHAQIDERLAAVRDAEQQQWYDRAVYGLQLARTHELTQYRLRFPLHQEATIRREAAKNRLDPAWVAAEIRAESLFDPLARSSANARGLMQLIPPTGEAVARRLGIPYSGEASLHDPETNIILGTAYLRELLDKAGESLPVVIAGYNAGPNAAARWRSQRPALDADLWIETIPYKETREYVARVLSFSVIYDWRMNGDALRLRDRMGGRLQGERVAFACPDGVQSRGD